MQRNRNNKWTAEEEEALLAGIAKHGFGKWANILGDPKFAAQLLDRTNVNLKDKWRNMQNRVKTVKSSSIFISPAKTCPVVVSNEPSPDISNDNRYNAMVFEAISTINDEKGSDLSEILSFIEEQHEVPQNFKKLLSYSLRILVSQDKLKKVQQHRYKISVTKAIKPTLTLRPKDSTKLPELPSTSVILTTSKETQEIEAAANKVAERINELAEENRVWHEEREDFRMFLSECLTILVSQGKLEKVLDHYKISELENKVLEAAPEVVAMKLAESDKKRLIAGEALEEEERMNKLVEESQTMLELCLEIQEQCALGEEVFLR